MNNSTFKSKHCHKIERLLRKKEKTKKSTIEDEPSRKVEMTSKTLFKSKSKDKSKQLNVKSVGEKLAERCRKTLELSRFRSMNEFIYEHSSDEGFNYMKDKEQFQRYHEAYEQIVNKWPLKPVDFIADTIQQAEGPDWEKECIIADMGCGRWPTLKRKLTKAKVISYDACSDHKDVTVANLTNVPTKNHTCQYVVFSLSLMATNIRDLILEANRILKRKGNLLIAEVSSRFEEETVDKFVDKMKNYGFDLVEKKFLPPNEFFVFFIFVKKKDIMKSTRKSLPDITLKACHNGDRRSLSFSP
ncbi:uncharacterized protein LOC141849750 [Brevipalpus obovatus]|uniref:uncharacterized protein LOC141849750 n=1 Tax=Brevipalpus obovatus TaxID=246614 RepID=UPI003D9F8B8D